jgi:hypothetical protein
MEREMPNEIGRLCCGSDESSTNNQPGDAKTCHPNSGDDNARTKNQAAPATSAELVTVTPGRKLGSLRLPDPNQLQAFAQPREADVVGRDPLPRVAEELLALLDRFPPFFERREVPLLALATNNPEAPEFLVERQAPSHGERLDHLVRAE